MKSLGKSFTVITLALLLICGFTLHGLTLGKSSFSEVCKQHPGGIESAPTPHSDPLTEILGVKKLYSSADQRWQFWFNATGVLVAVVEAPEPKLSKADILRQYPGLKFEADPGGSLCLNAEVSPAPGVFKCIRIDPDSDTVTAITTGLLPSHAEEGK
ncbi:MAG: hypothetical protein ACLFUU_09785 [Desulfobacteraceae bacterium]